MVVVEEAEESEISKVGQRPERDERYLHWLERLRKVIVSELDHRGLSTQLIEAKANLAKAYEEYRESGDGERRYRSHHVRTSLSLLTYAETQDPQVRSAVASAQRIESNLRNVKAIGPPRSEARRAQFETETASVDDLRARSFSDAMIVGPPRRSIDDTEEKHRKWWVDQAEGLDLVYAATSFEAKRWTRTTDRESRQALYDHHLRDYTESKVVDILNSKPVLDTLAGLGDESSSSCRNKFTESSSVYIVVAVTSPVPKVLTPVTESRARWSCLVSRLNGSDGRWSRMREMPRRRRGGR